MIKALLTSLFPPRVSGFGSAGISRQRECGAILVVGGGGWENAQMGVEFDETGINISRHEVRYYLAVNNKLPGKFGTPRARAFADGFSRDITQEGEMIGAIPYTLATACSLANDVDDFGDGSGDVFFDEATVTQERAGWKTANMKLSSDPEITVA